MFRWSACLERIIRREGRTMSDVRMTKPDRMLELERLLDEVGRPGRERLAKADSVMAGLLPTPFDWMTEEERQVMHELKMAYQELEREWNAGAHDRVMVRRRERMRRLSDERESV